jgi:hypothetical protein
VSLDLVAAWTIGFFAACAAGGVLGWLVGRFTTFELGLGVGLLVPGLISLWFTARFALDYRTFTRSPTRALGTVVAVEDVPANAAGSVTTPVAIVEYVDGHGEKRRTRSGGGSGLHVDDAVTVVDGRVARVHELRNGGGASMLFGTFPLSLGLYFLFGSVYERLYGDRREHSARRGGRMFRSVTVYANLVLVAGILWGAFRSESVLDGIREGFLIVAIGLWIHCANGIAARADPRWSLGMGVLALNFTAWVVALGIFVVAE